MPPPLRNVPTPAVDLIKSFAGIPNSDPNTVKTRSRLVLSVLPVPKMPVQDKLAARAVAKKGSKVAKKAPAKQPAAKRAAVKKSVVGKSVS